MTNKIFKLSEIKKSASYQFRVNLDQSNLDYLIDCLENGQTFTGEDAPKLGLLNGSYWLYDGFHRTEAATEFGLDEMEFQVVEVESEYELMLLAIRANTKHGKRNTTEDYKKMVTALINSEHREGFMKHMFALDTTKIASTIGCSSKTVARATEDLRSSLDKDMDEYVLDKHEEGMSARAIADVIGCGNKTVSRILEECVKTDSVPNDTQSTSVKPSVVPTISPAYSSDAHDDFDSDWDALGEDRALTTDELQIESDEECAPFDIDDTAAAGLVSAVERGDAIDTSNKEQVKMESKINDMKSFIGFFNDKLPVISDGALQHMRDQILAELERRGVE